jgi:hypothetical protein
MKFVRKWLADDGTEFNSKAEAEQYELGGTYAEAIKSFLDSRDYSGKSDRAVLADRTRSTKIIAEFLRHQAS